MPNCRPWWRLSRLNYFLFFWFSFLALPSCSHQGVVQYLGRNTCDRWPSLMSGNIITRLKIMNRLEFINQLWSYRDRIANLMWIYFWTPLLLRQSSKQNLMSCFKHRFWINKYLGLGKVLENTIRLFEWRLCIVSTHTHTVNQHTQPVRRGSRKHGTLTELCAAVYYATREMGFNTLVDHHWNNRISFRFSLHVEYTSIILDGVYSAQCSCAL